MATVLAEDDLARTLSNARSMSQKGSLTSRSKRSRASGSFGEAWSNPGDVFARNGREEEEEEDLKWAAIERLPTYDRVRKTMLKQVFDDGRVGYEEVDVQDIGVRDRKNLLESVLKFVEEDNEKFLSRLRERTDK